MKNFVEFLNEEASDNDYHHTSIEKIDQKQHSSSEHPMWLSHNAHQAEGWHKNAKEDAGSAHTYKAKVNGKIANHKDPEVKQILRKHGVKQKDYHETLVSNPESHEVHNHPATQALKKHGYVGYSHPDYNPHNFQKSHDSTVVFHRKDVSLEHKKSN